MSAVSLHNTSFAYSATSAPVLRGVRLTVPYGGRLLLVGANGAGKSTLLRLIAGRRMPTGGRVESLGLPAFEATELAGQVTLVTDEWDESLCSLSPAELLSAHVARHVAVAGAAGSARAQRLLGVLGIDEALLGCPTLAACSSGQRRRVQLLLALLPARPLIVLDEATNALDVAARAALLGFLRDESTERGATVIYCTHIFDGLDGWPTHAAHLGDGCISHTAGAEALNSVGAAYALALEWILPPSSAHAARALGWLLELNAHEMRERAARAAPGGEDRPFAPRPPMPCMAPTAAGDTGHGTAASGSAGEPAAASLPLGWGSRGVATAGAFGDHVWEYEEPPEVRGAKLARLNQAVDIQHAPVQQTATPTPATTPATLHLTQRAHLPSLPPDPPRQQSAHAPGGADPSLAPSPAAAAAPVLGGGAVAEPGGGDVNPMQRMMAPVLQAALAQMQVRLGACAEAVGSFDPAAVAAEAAELSKLWQQASVALTAFAGSKEPNGSAGGGGGGGGGSGHPLGPAYEPRLMVSKVKESAEDRTAPRPLTGPGADRASAPGGGGTGGGDHRGSAGGFPLGWGSRETATSEAELVRMGIIMPNTMGPR